MFEKEYPLPGAEQHFSLHDRDRFARACQHHADVRSHVVRAFIVMFEVICVFGHEPVKKLFQIAARRGRGIFHDHETTAGVLNENVHNSTAHPGSADLALDLRCDLISAFAVCSNFKAILFHRHR